MLMPHIYDGYFPWLGRKNFPVLFRVLDKDVCYMVTDIHLVHGGQEDDCIVKVLAMYAWETEFHSLKSHKKCSPSYVYNASILSVGCLWMLYEYKWQMNENFQRNRAQGFVLFKMDFKLEFK